VIYQHEIREKKAKYTGPRPELPAFAASLRKRMLHYLASRALDAELAIGNGWYPAYYRGAPRIIIPCSNEAGAVYFQGRAMDDNKLRYASPYVPREDSIVIVWPDDGKYQSRFGGVVVEGPMDALAAAGLGFVGVAIMGNCPTEEVIDHLARFARGFQPVLVLPDIDAPSFGAAIVGPLAQRGISASMKTAMKKDLAEMTVEEREEFLNG